MSNACIDIQATLPSYLDQELDSTELLEFERHVADCHDCQTILEVSEGEHTMLQAQLKNTPVAPATLRKSIHAMLNSEDALQKSVQRHVQWRKWLSWSLPIGASGLAVAALALFIVTNIRNPNPPGKRLQPVQITSSQVTTDAARQHFKEPLFVSSDPRAVSQSVGTFLKNSVEPPHFSSQDVRLLGWAPIQLNGKQTPTFAYDVRDKRGVFRVHAHVIAKSQIDLRSQAKFVSNGITFWIDSAMGLNMVTYVAPNSVAYVFSSELSTNDLLELVTTTNILARVVLPQTEPMK